MESKFIKMELDDIPKLPLNEAEIRQVIINLVKNANRYFSRQWICKN